MRTALKTTVLAVAASFLLGCASLGIGMTEKAETPKERFIAALVDYRIATSEVVILVNGWTASVERGDPLADKYLQAAIGIKDVQARAKQAMETGIKALAQDPPVVGMLDASTRILNAILIELQNELYAPAGG